MKNYFSKLLGVLLALLTCQILTAQNENWTMPPNNFQPSGSYFALPQPNGDEVYEGDPSNFVHAAYSTPDGEMQLFSVDDRVYDKNGYAVGELTESGNLKEGFNERLILPMGSDCKRYAVIYRSRVNNLSYASQLCTQALYMAIYDTEGINVWNDGDPVIGALESFPGFETTVLDISERDGPLYFQNGLFLHGYESTVNGPARQQNVNMHIAASELIDGCYYRVYVFDGNNLIEYHLTENDLEYQGVIQNVPNTGLSSTLRSEMELIKLPSGDYRIAIPANDDEGPTGSGITQSIVIYDIDGVTGDIITGSEIVLDYRNLNSSQGPAEIYGLEFDQTGQYLYITNGTNSVHTNLLEVYDVDNTAYVNLTMSMTPLVPFQKSFIERYGSDLYLASSTHIGRIVNASNPVPATFNGTFTSLAGTYGNDAGNQFFQRQLLPEQLDMPYPDPIDNMSCDCCVDNIDGESVITAASGTWNASSNPINPGSAEIYVKDELRIPAGVTLELVDMTFYFGPDARVVIEKGNGLAGGGHLIMTRTTFTADKRCSDETKGPRCLDEKCEDDFWIGVRVIGDETIDQNPTGGDQGRLSMKAGAMIEYATIGVRAGIEGCADCGGGILDLVNSFFKDNIAGVVFDPYVGMSGSSEIANLSLIQNMNFTRTADIAADTEPVHVFVKDCSTINLRGNMYQNEAWANYAPALRGRGVRSSNSSIDERWFCANSSSPCNDKIRSTYQNLGKGFSAISSISSRTVNVCHAIFRNNNLGVQTFNLIRPMILDNDFFVPNETNSTGIYLVSSDQYAVENNYFTALSSSPVVWMFGIAVQSSGPANNELYRNVFEDITIGIVSAGQNADVGPLNDPNDCGSTYEDGLRWKCNRFNQTIPYADIFVESGNVSVKQGECDFTTFPARNIFSHSGSSARDIRVRDTLLLECGNVLFNIEYKYNELPSSPSSLEARLEPLVFTVARVTPTSCGSIAPGQFLPSLLDCPVKNTCLDDLASVIDLNKSDDVDFTMDYFVELAALIYGGSEFDLASSAFSEEEYSLWTQMIEAYQWDTTGDFTTEGVLELLNTYQPSSGGRFASILSHKLGLEDPSWLDSNQSLQDETVEISISATDGELPYILNDVIDPEQMDNPSFVRKINELYAENGQPLRMIIPEPSDLELPDAFPESEGKTNKVKKVPNTTIQPNPFRDAFNLIVSTDADYTILQVMVYDILGRQLLNKTYGEMSQIEIDGSAFPAGVLIYSVFIDGELFDTGRIVKAE